MSRILVIQPHKMLQQAILLSLFPRHEARIMAAIPNDAELENVDAMIIDGASLRETQGFSEPLVRSLQRWKIPTVWIESGDASAPTIGARMVVIKKPIVKEALQQALAECLGEAKPTARSTAIQQPDPASGASALATGDSEPAAGGEVIELVDVVEETPRQRKETP